MCAIVQCIEERDSTTVYCIAEDNNDKQIEDGVELDVTDIEIDQVIHMCIIIIAYYISVVFYTPLIYEVCLTVDVAVRR